MENENVGRECRVRAAGQTSANIGVVVERILELRSVRDSLQPAVRGGSTAAAAAAAALTVAAEEKVPH